MQAFAFRVWKYMVIWKTGTRDNKEVCILKVKLEDIFRFSHLVVFLLLMLLPLHDNRYE